MYNKEVSVIIPCFNSQLTIKKCVTSIINNKYCKEIIIVDDGSTDSSSNIIKDMERKNPIIKYYYKNNGGVSTARNYGISKAEGNYILFVDSDDYLSEKAIDNAYTFLIENNLDICNFRMEEINFIRKSEETINKLDIKIFNHENISDAMINTSLYSSCAKLIKKNIILENNVRFNEKITYSEDYIFSLNIYKYVKKVGICDSSIYYVENINPNSISKSYVKNMSESIFEKRKSLNEIFQLYPDFEEKYFNKNMGNEHFWFIIYCDNLFKNNSPYNFFSAYKIIKNKYNFFKKTPEFKDKSKKVKPKKKMDKIYYFLIHTHLPILIAMTLKLKNILIEYSVKRRNKNEKA